jgi:hypothetical protein
MAFTHDVFISYAHVDDLPLDPTRPGQSAGWVTTLVQHLENFLGQEIGRAEGFTVWKDKYNLRGNNALTPEIKAVLERTAIFIAILSPGYLSSAWCPDEARFFAQRFAGDLAGRVFVVERARLDDAAVVPQELTGLRNYRFWYVDDNKQPRTFAKPMPEEQEIQYFRQVQDLARDVRSNLKAMADGPLLRPPAARPLTGSRANGSNGAGVAFLAEVTDDLEFRRLEVSRYLEQRGVVVLPEAGLPLGRAQFEAALDADLVRSLAFVQLLGPMPGKRPPDVPDGYGWLQHDLARRRGMRVLQWRSPELDLTSIEWPRHRELLELETVQATSLETFKSAVAAALAPPPAPPPSRRHTDRPLVFLNTEPRHRMIAAEIRSAFGNRAAWVEPLRAGSAEEVRVDFEQNLIDCDAMVMVYADNAGWARAQLRAFYKLTPRRERPVRAIPVIDAPAKSKPELGFDLEEMVIIDGRSGIGPEALARLSEALRL